MRTTLLQIESMTAFEVLKRCRASLNADRDTLLIEFQKLNHNQKEMIDKYGAEFYYQRLSENYAELSEIELKRKEIKRLIKQEQQ